MIVATRPSRASLGQLWRYYQAGIVNTAFGYGLYAAFVAAGLNMYVAQIVAHGWLPGRFRAGARPFRQRGLGGTAHGQGRIITRGSLPQFVAARAHRRRFEQPCQCGGDTIGLPFARHQRLRHAKARQARGVIGPIADIRQDQLRCAGEQRAARGADATMVNDRAH